MALKPCRECGKEVSTGAKVCPHCGVRHPAVSNRDRAIALIVLVIGGFCTAIFIYSTGSSTTSPNENSPHQNSSSEQTAAANSPDDAACLQDLQCIGKKFLIPASANCQQILEEQAKVISKWEYKIGESSFSPIFSLLRWADQDKRQIIYTGDQAKFQNGFGAWQRVRYQCTFDIQSQKPVSAEFLQD